MGREVATVIVNAEALREEGEAQGMRARWAVLRNGIDAEHFRLATADAAARAALGLDPTRPVVGTVGRLERRKGQDQLIAALAELGHGNGAGRPQAVLVGDGPSRAALAAQVTRLGLDQEVRFLGMLPDVRPALAAMDVFVLPSWEEGMSNALMEAMAAERPVVATAVGGNGELITHERTGLLVPPGDPRTLAQAIGALLQDPARAARLAHEAREMVTQRFGIQARVAELEQLYLARLAARGWRAA